MVSRARTSRRSSLRTWIALACALALLTASTSPAAAEDGGAADPAVRAANEHVSGAEARLEEATASYDAAARTYEDARAHHERLRAELDVAGETVTDAAAAVTVSYERFARQVAEAYMRPDTDLALAGAVLAAPDAATAVHRAALLQRLTVRAGRQVGSVEGQEREATDQYRQQVVIEVGTAAAAAGERERADALAGRVREAESTLDEARTALADAEAAARRRAAEEARERARAAAAAATRAVADAAAEARSADGASLPAVGGKVCPIGAPNGFIDSWGYPRSGGRRHKGVDMFADRGMPLYAVADGAIRRVWWSSLGGLSIDLVDEAGNRYYYAHLSSAAVDGGERVVAGQVIGANGNTGNARSTPPHLHWQYHPGGGPAVNPYPLARSLCR